MFFYNTLKYMAEILASGDYQLDLIDTKCF